MLCRLAQCAVTSVHRVLHQSRTSPRVFDGDEAPLLSRPTTRQAGADSGAGRTTTSKGDPCTAAPSKYTSTFCTPVWTHRTTALQCTVQISDLKGRHQGPPILATPILWIDSRGCAGHRSEWQHMYCLRSNNQGGQTTLRETAPCGGLVQNTCSSRRRQQAPRAPQRLPRWQTPCARIWPRGRSPSGQPLCPPAAQHTSHGLQ